MTWSETVGLRAKLDRSVTEKIGLGLGLAGLILCCETRSCHARRHNDLEGHSNFSSTFIVSLFCAWNITTVEISSGVYLLKSEIGKRINLLSVVLVLRIWSCLHHWE